MFNLSGSEIVVILLLALVILGPDKLPDAMRRAGRTWSQLRRMSDSFQDEVRKGFDEPTKELRETASTVTKAAGFATKPVAATAAAVKKSLLDPDSKPFPADPSEPAAEPVDETFPADPSEPAVEPVADPVAEPIADAVGDQPSGEQPSGDVTDPAVDSTSPTS